MSKIALGMSVRVDYWMAKMAILASSATNSLLDRHQTCKPMMVSCEFNSHKRQLLFLKTHRHLFCTEMSDLCYLRKPRIKPLQDSVISDICMTVLTAEVNRND